MSDDFSLFGHHATYKSSWSSDGGQKKTKQPFMAKLCGCDHSVRFASNENMQQHFQLELQLNPDKIATVHIERESLLQRLAEIISEYLIISLGPNQLYGGIFFLFFKFSIFQNNFGFQKSELFVLCG